MKQNYFPKPMPAKPLEESDWLLRTDRAEVGREPFFCGRDEEYSVFQRTSNSLSRGFAGGGTMIFQGAPGSGKTALMQECMEAVREHSTAEEPWVAASIAPGALKSPATVISEMIHASKEESRRLSKVMLGADSRKLANLSSLGRQLFDELLARGFSLAGVSVGAKPDAGKASSADTSIDAMVRRSAPLLKKAHYVIFVDEAQNTPVDPTTVRVIDFLHRDSRGIALVAAFFGLSDTEERLRECGLSRISDERIVNLEPLSTEEAKRSLALMLETYYGGSDEERDAWADTLAALSQGWPQHINRIGVAAGRVIRANGGKMQEHLLAEAMEKGAERKNDYYDRRLSAGYKKVRIYTELALAARPNDELSLEEIRQLSAQELKRTETPFDEFMRLTLHAGILSPADTLHEAYRFPIPSLADYLRSADKPIESD